MKTAKHISLQRRAAEWIYDLQTTAKDLKRRQMTTKQSKRRNNPPVLVLPDTLAVGDEIIVNKHPYRILAIEFLGQNYKLSLKSLNKRTKKDTVTTVFHHKDLLISKKQ